MDINIDDLASDEFTFPISAGEGHRFLPDALDKNIGKECVVPNWGKGKITAVQVVDEGMYALVTVERIKEVKEDGN